MFPTPDMLARFGWWLEEAVRIGPLLPVALPLAVAFIEAILLPQRRWLKGVAAGGVLLCGVVSITLLNLGQRSDLASAADRHAAARSAEIAELSALRGLYAQWDTLSKGLPAPPSEVEGKFDTIDNALASLSAKVAGIGDQIAALKTSPAGRSIDPAAAAKLATALRQYGSYRAVVSCAQNDPEAYAYANQLVGLLHTAGWDANGPEATANVTDRETMDIVVLVRDPTQPGAAKILLDAFNQANIPHQPGISADTSIPDTATVELFVAKKP